MKKANNPKVLGTLGNNIKKIRLLKGLSQENLASDLQTSINFVSLIENGKTGLSIQTLVNICQSLNVDTNTLFSEIVEPIHGKTDSFIVNSLDLFDEKDKIMVIALINYIINSKN